MTRRRIELVHWNPRRPRALPAWIGRRVPIGPRVDNFGDLLGPLIVGELLRRRGIRIDRPRTSGRLLTVGSVLHLARDGDVVWGSGVNGKVMPTVEQVQHLDLRAVRGPRTAAFLRDHGVEPPAIFGDPGLLVGWLWTREELAVGWPEVDVLVVPNLNDAGPRHDDVDVLHPRRPLRECLGRIAASGFVTGSSLHGIVVAESLGIPARLIRSGAEPSLKYDDYYGGTGRSTHQPAAGRTEAEAMGGEVPPTWRADDLVRSFPYELWRHG